MKPGIVNACEGRPRGRLCCRCGQRLGKTPAPGAAPQECRRCPFFGGCGQVGVQHRVAATETEPLPLALAGLAFVRASKGGLGFTMALGSGFVIRKLDQVWGKLGAQTRSAAWAPPISHPTTTLKLLGLTAAPRMA